MAAPPARRSWRRLVWLLSVALLLPIAQTAATWHVLSLSCMHRSDAHGKPLSHLARCDFCLTAAGFQSAAATGQVLAPPPPIRLHEAPTRLVSSFASAAPASAYRSRAPPIALS